MVSLLLCKGERQKMINESNINYRLSLNIIKGLMDKNLITREEFDAIDKENKKSFKCSEYQGLT